MTETPRRQHIVALSALASGDASAFTRLAQQARQRNSRLGISGAMLFDGQRCCQWLHGDPEVLQSALVASGEEAHFEPPSIVFQASLPSEHFSAEWRTGYVEPDAIDQLLRSCTQDADAAFSALGKLLVDADLDAPPQATAGG